VWALKLLMLDTAHVVTFGFKRFGVGVRGVRGVLMEVCEHLLSLRVAFRMWVGHRQWYKFHRRGI